MHEWLLKLEHYGDRGVAFHLLKSYFTDRKQYLNTNKSISSLKPISTGVPQGPILGPLFYIIYVNDLHYAVNCTSGLYADDICLLVENKTGELQNLLNTELYKLLNWMTLNQSTIIPNKIYNLGNLTHFTRYPYKISAEYWWSVLEIFG